MSLHGLNAPPIAQAAAAVKAASAGWFLLKYATRDEIELYSTGFNGVPEAASKVAEYSEKSPLYGIVTHAGKKALLKYVPTGTSRLLQARVKVHFDAISTHFLHDTELSITQSDELTGETLAASLPSPPVASSPLSPAISLTNPVSPIPSSLGRLPSIAGSSSAHGSSVNGDSAIKEEDASSDTHSSRTARLLADVRAGKLESHEVLAALKITPTRDSDRRPSDNSLERLKEGTSALRTEDLKRSASSSSIDPQLVQLPSPGLSVSSNNADSYRGKVKVGPRPSHSADSSATTNVASLPAGVSLPKSAAQAPSPPAQVSDSPTSPQFATLPAGLGENNMRPIVQSPASAAGAVPAGKAGSTSGSAMTLPAGLGQRKGSGSSQQNPRDQQAIEKMRLMKALEIQRKKNAKPKAGDEPLSAEPSPWLPSAVDSHTTTPFEAPTALGDALDQASGLKSTQAPLAQVDVASANSLHAATKSSPTLGSMVNFSLQGRQNAARDVPMGPAQVSGEHSPKSTDKSAGKSRLPDLTASGPATLELASSGDKPNDGIAKLHIENVNNGASNGTSIGTANVQSKAPAPINTSFKPDASGDDNQTTPVAEVRESDWPRSNDTQPSELDVAKPDFSRMHSAHVSISTSISGTSSFLEELETSNVEQAQPMTMVKSPITPTFPRSPSFPASASSAPIPPNTHDADTSLIVTQTENAAKSPEVATGTSPAVEAAHTSETFAGVQERDAKSSTHSVILTHPAPDRRLETLTQAEVLTAQEPASSAEAAGNAEQASNDGANLVSLQPSAASVEATANDKSPAQQQENMSLAVENHAFKPVTPSPDTHTVDPMKAIIEEELGLTARILATEGAVMSAENVPDPTSLPQNTSSSMDLSNNNRGTPEDENAEPLSVSKGGSPGTKKHPTVQPPHIWGGALRSASNPSSDNPRHLSPVPDLAKMTRSASVASNNSSMLRPDSPSGIKKVGVGSRIADRIKALEKSSGGTASNSQPVYAGSVVSVSSRKSSFHTPPGSSGTDSRRMGASSSPNNIFARRFGTVHGDSGRTGRPTPSGSPESTREQQANAPSDAQLSTSSRPEYLRHKSSDSQTANYSLPPSRDGASSTISQNKGKSSFSGWSGRRDSSETNRTGHSRQSSIESTGTNSDKKKENKAKKLMKRMSGAFSPRKERSTPTFGEPIMEGAEPEPPKTSETAYTTRPATRDDSSGGMVSRGNSRPAIKLSNNIVVGEINVQFPDTLLWKRRHVELDGEGYIILVASTLEKSSRAAQKKFHISEFHRPYIPDQEREELPYSIILDFQDSSTLQCACQNAVDQKNVLQAFLQFHASFTKE